MKGIVLAGWSGTRLYPLTISVSKQLLPVYDKPMIYYPISTLIAAHIRDILIISTPHDLPGFQKLLWDGSQIWCRFSYAVQPTPDGLAQAFIIGEEFIGDDKVALILGDNIFYGSGMGRILVEHQDIDGGMIFAYHVEDPERYGIVEFDTTGKVLSIEEKPKTPKSSFAVPWLYFYDNDVVKIAKQVKPSARGELEITDINNAYLEAGKLQVTKLGRGTAWLDTGTVDSLMQANQFVKVVQDRQWLKIGCIEEIAYHHKRIDRAQLESLWQKYGKNDYGKYLLLIAKQY
jgi:glucose-1-phosphate thymidylyltransferase